MKEAKLSFAMETKEEIARRDFPDTVIRPLLSSFCKCAGTIHLSSQGEELDLGTESSVIAKFLYLSLHNIYGIDPHFAYSKAIGFRKKTKFHVLLSEPDFILSDLEVDYLSGKLPKHYVDSEEESAAYLSGAFLAAGSVNDPASTNYHLEISSTDQTYAGWLSHLINRVSGHHFNSKVIKRRNKWVVYLKKAEQISDFLALIGASEACLKFESVRLDRDFANIGNRLSNLDGANFSKTMGASQTQLEQIAYLEERGLLENNRNPKLQILAKLRKANPDASLSDLAEAMSEELASTVTKSNINHLFRALAELYRQTKEEESDGQ